MGTGSGKLCGQAGIFESFARELLGVRYGRVPGEAAVCVLLYSVFAVMEYRIQIAPGILCFTVWLCAGGVMWRCVSSHKKDGHLRSILMMPFDRKELLFSCVGAYSLYTVLTAVTPLLAVAAAVSRQEVREWTAALICAADGMGMAAVSWLYRRYRWRTAVWASITAAGILLLDMVPMLAFITGNLAVLLILLGRADAYWLCSCKGEAVFKKKSGKHLAVYRYFLRYLGTHRNYLANMGILWAVAAVLPAFFRGLDRSFSLPMGFAILSLNTPAGILLSCDPSTERAVRLLPGQAARFFLPYGIFVFLCNMAADLIYLGSGWLQMGSVPVMLLSGVPPASLSRMASGVGTAAVFSLLAAAGTVLLERFFPIRRWEAENDLWRHPRKYIVPAVLLLAAGIFDGVLS